jgi:hypothetical protein
MPQILLMCADFFSAIPLWILQPAVASWLIGTNVTQVLQIYVFVPISRDAKAGFKTLVYAKAEIADFF